ncbi:arsenic resistance protein [Hoyosella subflava]|uniref:Sodium Bile acid symporter family n=1 Tax=Hoyosella subflava (strain DSM 45089 / JCM 17490 / NBRC 109087 / DQS3-9A1) TaxID=443218 RepID=F6EF94_HOYSD|nr:sodium bile acid symporter family protein [Hoyosella subflava]AEF38673.1 Sodium Bile acid symporter family [Hoyosella subflava DQS3-9A1]
MPALATTAILLLAIVGGATVGLTTPELIPDGLIDVTIFALLVLLFLPISSQSMRRAFRNVRFTASAWLANFVIVAPFGALLAWLLLSGHPAAIAGLTIYFAAPCTDWFLAFTKLAGGETAGAAALIPLNLATQVALFPVVVWLVSDHVSGFAIADLFTTMLVWFALPFGVAALIRALLPRAGYRRGAEALLSRLPDVGVTVALGLLVFQIFAVHAGTITGALALAPLVLAAVVAFFGFALAVSQVLGRAAGLSSPERTALTMTTSARNAPLMLALTMTTIPDQPLMYSVIVLAMLAEFPHLTALAYVFRRKFGSAPTLVPLVPRRRSNHAVRYR